MAKPKTAAAFAFSDAMILWAVYCADRTKGITLGNVIAGIDYINHGIPRLAELRGALARLAAAGYVTARTSKGLLVVVGKAREFFRKQVKLPGQSPWKQIDRTKEFLAGVSTKGPVRKDLPWPFSITDEVAKAAIDEYLGYMEPGHPGVRAKFSWVTGNPSALVRRDALPAWPGRAHARGNFRDSGAVVEADGRLLVLCGVHETTCRPLKGGGALLVIRYYSEGDAATARHLKSLPEEGWRRLSEAFTSGGGEHVLFDAGLKGADYEDPENRRFFDDEFTLIRISLSRGRYHVEVRDRWRPDKRNQFTLVRLIPAR